MLLGTICPRMEEKTVHTWMSTHLSSSRPSNEEHTSTRLRIVWRRWCTSSATWAVLPCCIEFFHHVQSIRPLRQRMEIIYSTFQAMSNCDKTLNINMPAGEACKRKMSNTAAFEKGKWSQHALTQVSLSAGIMTVVINLLITYKSWNSGRHQRSSVLMSTSAAISSCHVRTWGRKNEENIKDDTRIHNSDSTDIEVPACNLPSVCQKLTQLYFPSPFCYHKTGMK